MNDKYKMQQQVALMDLISTEINVAMQRKEYGKVENLLKKQMRLIHEIQRINNKQLYEKTLKSLAIGVLNK